MNYDFSGVDKPENDKNLYGLRYAEFVVPLVKAVQELSTSSDKKDSVISGLQNDIKNLQAEMKELRSIVLAANHLSLPGGAVTDASLGQNTPNPFDRTTTIRYRLPQRYAAAQILITDKAGRTLKTIAVTGTGNGSTTFTTNELASGSYQYSLLVDGQLISTRQMEHLR